MSSFPPTQPASGTTMPPDVSPWPHGQADNVAFQGLPAFRTEVLALLQRAGHGRYDLLLCDPDFEHWPLGEPAAVKAFNAWALASRHSRCTLIAAHFDAFPRQHARWVRWRTPWSHRIRCLQAPHELAQDLPRSLVLQGHAGLEVLDAAQWRGMTTREPVRLARLVQQSDAISQRSSDAFPPTALGL